VPFFSEKSAHLSSPLRSPLALFSTSLSPLIETSSAIKIARLRSHPGKKTVAHIAHAR
jgi:hypothetical protein